MCKSQGSGDNHLNSFILRVSVTECQFRELSYNSQLHRENAFIKYIWLLFVICLFRGPCFMSVLSGPVVLITYKGAFAFLAVAVKVRRVYSAMMAKTEELKPMKMLPLSHSV